MEKAVAIKNAMRAFKRVEATNRATGVDGMRIEELRPCLKEHWLMVEALVTRAYGPAPVRRVEISKPTGGARLLGCPPQ